MSTRLVALCGLLVPLFAGCGPAAAPAPVDAAPAAIAPSTTPATTSATTPATTPATPGAPLTKAEAAKLDAIGPAPAKEPPLTQEEIDLIAADPATLSPELRRKRGYALRRKILQNPDSPSARQLEALRIAAEKGELQPHLPDRKGDEGATLHARNPGPSAAPGAATPDTSATPGASATPGPSATPGTPEPAPAKTPAKAP